MNRGNLLTTKCTLLLTSERAGGVENLQAVYFTPDTMNVTAVTPGLLPATHEGVGHYPRTHKQGGSRQQRRRSRQTTACGQCLTTACIFFTGVPPSSDTIFALACVTALILHTSQPSRLACDFL